MTRFFLIFTLSILMFALNAQVYGYHEEVDFESNIEFIRIDTSANNDWQIGIPQKEFFNGAYSIPNVIVTDTINAYSVNSKSSFYLSITDPRWFSGSPSTLSFYHKYDTESLYDGGYIDVSYDGGETWLNIIYDSTMFHCDWTPGFEYWGFNFYSDTDTLYNGINGFSGKSEDWKYSEFVWAYCIGVQREYPDSMMIRFNFISDSIQTYQEGWMIDDIILHSDICGSINDSFVNKISATIDPNPITNESVLRIRGIYDEEYTLSIINISGERIFSQILTTNEFPLNNLMLVDGIYLYILRFENNVTISGKFIKN
ncbi:MAG: T9SS type A sorting domain-containing protein [Bacteroidales bacterium]|nr:T9SS type A sorting domain-containing protein [Lentimicrobiaceae bacterium]MDD5695802.1 T9SS type A sorting domain-containing protein [Bacteroidales bacterium]